MLPIFMRQLKIHNSEVQTTDPSSIVCLRERSLLLCDLKHGQMKTKSLYQPALTWVCQLGDKHLHSISAALPAADEIHLLDQ